MRSPGTVRFVLASNYFFFVCFVLARDLLYFVFLVECGEFVFLVCACLFVSLSFSLFDRGEYDPTNYRVVVTDCR